MPINYIPAPYPPIPPLPCPCGGKGVEKGVSRLYNRLVGPVGDHISSGGKRKGMGSLWSLQEAEDFAGALCETERCCRYGGEHCEYFGGQCRTLRIAYR